jgi:hypothetical protein
MGLGSGRRRWRQSEGCEIAVLIRAEATWGCRIIRTRPVKSFELRALLARVRAVLRRTGTVESQSPSGQGFAFGGWIFDINIRSLSRETGETKVLTTGEFNLLEAFVKRSHRVMSRDNIMIF